MDQERKWTSWVLIAVIVIVAGTALVVTTLATTQPATPKPTPPAAQSALPSTLPSTAPLPEASAPPSRTANASVIGYGGPVLVRLTLDAQGRITALDVGGARFQETEGVGSRVKEPDYVRSFIGQTPPIVLGEVVDSVAGATLSSQALVDAINDAAAYLAEPTSDMN